MFFVYILKCSDGSYYTGHTENLETRLAQHHQQYYPSCYTFNRLPVELLFQQEYDSRTGTFVAERQIKGWSRKKKETMMKRDWAEVSRLSKHVNAKILRQAQDERES